MKPFHFLPLLLVTGHCFGCAQAAPAAKSKAAQPKSVSSKLVRPKAAKSPVKPTILDERQQTLKRAADAILARQSGDGSIMMGLTGGETPEKARVVPYFSNLAALGLVDAFRELRDPRYLAGARQWVAWYDAHRNSDGTVFDYAGGAGNWQSTKDYDSTDSYASTYILLVLAIHRTQPDALWLESHLPFVEQSLQAIRLTLQPNSLTTAKPTWPVMYTMDNVEVLFGPRAAAELFTAAGQPARAAQMTQFGDSVEAAIGRDLWNSDKNYYRIGIQVDGGKMEGLEKWYPDVMANIIPIAWLPSSPRHLKLYNFLKTSFPTMLPTQVSTEDDLERLVWWGLAAKGADDAATLKQIKTRLNGFDTKIKSLHNVALPGHICHLLSNSPAIR